MTVKDRLARYHAKRHRSRTPEPYDSGGRRGGGPIFVLQRHAAGTLHFDFRLEIGGVLVSWSIPKGPSLNPSERRLGIRTGVDGQEQWLLIKKNDEAADRRRKPAKTQRESVLTGRTNKDLE